MKTKHYRFYFLYVYISVMFLLSFSGCGSRQEADLFLSEERDVQEEIPSLQDREQEDEKKQLFVDVSGAVRFPGVYELEEGSRVFQAVEAAGGFLEHAFPEQVNLAGILKDEQHIYIPYEPDSPEAILREKQTSGIASDGKVDLNTADLEQFMTLTGIGETRARAILEYRNSNGPFSSVEDIMNVQGIKEGTFAKIKDEIVVR